MVERAADTPAERHRDLNHPSRFADAPTMFAIADLIGGSPFDLHLGPYGDGHLYLGDGLELAPGSFVADPFYLDDLHLDDPNLAESNASGPDLVFEAWDATRDKGVIATAVRGDDATWIRPRIVIDEPFHLSYPHPVRTGEHTDLVLTESAESGGVRAYRRTPNGPWAYVTTIIDRPLLDPTPVEIEGVWYLFGCSPDGTNSDAELWVSNGDVLGPWSRHPVTPVLGDPARARPAGPCFTHDGQLFRVAQDCTTGYGRGVVAIPILDIGPKSYREGDAIQILTGNTTWWNRAGMHHVDIRPLSLNTSAAADQRATSVIGSAFAAVADGHRPRFVNG